MGTKFKEGICPVCGREFEYSGSGNAIDDGGVYFWTCPHCGATGEEGFSKVFDGHQYNVHLGNGEKWEDDGDKGPSGKIGGFASDRMAGMYQINLHYGYERSDATYETYHAFETTDIEELTDGDEMAAKLAGLLDCEPDDEDFDWNSMYIVLPEKTVERIKQEGRSELMFAMLEGPWRNDACKGYAIMAMERAGLDDETIRKVSSAMTGCFDDTSVEEAGRYYMKGEI